MQFNMLVLAHISMTKNSVLQSTIKAFEYSKPLDQTPFSVKYEYDRSRKVSVICTEHTDRRKFYVNDGYEYIYTSTGLVLVGMHT